MIESFLTSLSINNHSINKSQLSSPSSSPKLSPVLSSPSLSPISSPLLSSTKQYSSQLIQTVHENNLNQKNSVDIKNPYCQHSSEYQGYVEYIQKYTNQLLDIIKDNARSSGNHYYILFSKNIVEHYSNDIVVLDHSIIGIKKLKIVKSLVLKQFPNIIYIRLIPNTVDYLVNIEIDYNFKIKIDGLIPLGTHSLDFGDYNQPLLSGFKSIPTSVIHIKLGYSFNNYIHNNRIPLNLISLDCGSSFNQKIPIGTLSNTLKILRFGNSFSNVLSPGSVPSSVEYVQIPPKNFPESINFPVLPESVTSIELDYKLDSLQWEHGNKLPVSIKSLKVCGQHINPSSINPFSTQQSIWSNLTKIEFGDQFNSFIEPFVLPKTLLQLKFGYSFDKPLVLNSLPKNLQSLKFGEKFNQSISKNILPPTLKKLVLGESFNCEIVNSILPNSIEYLSFGEKYSCNIGPSVLPISLKTLVINKSFNHFIIDILPVNVQCLHLNKKSTENVLAALKISRQLFEKQLQQQILKKQQFQHILLDNDNDNDEDDKNI